MSQLHRAHISTILLVVLVVSSLGLVAATIDSAVGVETDRNSPRSDIEQTPQSTSERLEISVSQDGTSTDGNQQRIDLVYCVGFLQNPIVICGIILGVSTVVYTIYRRHNVATAGLVSAGIIPVLMFAYFFLTNCRGSSGRGSTLFSGNSVLDGSSGIAAPTVSPIAVVLLFGVFATVAVALLVTTAGDEESFESSEENDIEPDAADFARAAGRAANRIEKANAPVDNAVYRAWVEMTGLLKLENPKSTPPQEFARAAIESGLDEDDVSELTKLFTDVRYGGKSAEDRTDRALTVLRNIEQTYRESLDQSEETHR